MSKYDEGYIAGLRTAELICLTRSSTHLVPSPAYGPLEAARLCADAIKQHLKEHNEKKISA